MEHGKKVCNELKRVRQEIADANGIAYSPAVCDHKGDCDGTCPTCEEEVKYIERQLDLRRALGKAVVVAGLGLSVASCQTTKTKTVNVVELTGIVEAPPPTEMVDSTAKPRVDSCTVKENKTEPIRGKMRMDPPVKKEE